MTLYGSPVSPYVARVLLAIRYKGLKIPLADAPGGSLKSPAYLAINPYGKMPALDADGGHVIESEIICEYLDERFPEKSILPGDALARARARTISRALDLYVLPGLLGLLGQMNPVTRDQPLVDRNMADIRKGLDGLEFLLVGPWAAGPQLTLADCTLVPTCFYLERFLPVFGSIDAFAGHPRMAAVWAVAKADPLVAGLLDEMGTGLDAFMRRRPANS
ncbi:glutathione S-transferase family protein [Oleisolibacter albus]|uniref:glutathione S-transferase family protein n=1 Tax=Oleisolibacter albus TaxID=2171757 RepID=UPI00138FB0B0|nr:glutathione S-transferase family protein [Oleisolibacter albus]